MATDNLKTRHDEMSFPTSDLKEMAGKYLAATVVREWKEDVLDSDTGELVPINRSEVIMQKGELLTPDNVSLLNFYLQAGEIMSVSVSNVRRTGELIEVGKDTIWCISVSGGGSNKKRKYLLFAKSLYQAISIARDYLEQTLEGTFKIESAKSFTSCIVIPDDNLRRVVKDEDGDTVAEEDGNRPDFYNINTSVKTREMTMTYNWLVLAASVDDAKVRIHRYIDKLISNSSSESQNWQGYELTVLSGACVSVSCVIPKEFSEAYFEWEEKEKIAENPDKLLKAISRASSR